MLLFYLLLNLVNWRRIEKQSGCLRVYLSHRTVCVCGIQYNSLLFFNAILCASSLMQGLATKLNGLA